MQINPLGPYFTFLHLEKTPEDLSFSFEVKRAAIGPYVEARWGWDEDYQRAVHLRNFDEKPFFAIEGTTGRIGTVSFLKLSSFIRFGEFYIFPAMQKQGFG